MDEAIVRTAQLMQLYGLTADATYKAIADSEWLKAQSLEIGPGQVEKLHTSWRNAARKAWEAGADLGSSKFLALHMPGDFTKDSRVDHRPFGELGKRLTNLQLADVLLQNGGRWPRDRLPAGDLMLTAKHRKSRN